MFFVPNSSLYFLCYLKSKNKEKNNTSKELQRGWDRFSSYLLYPQTFTEQNIGEVLSYIVQYEPFIFLFVVMQKITFSRSFR